MENNFDTYLFRCSALGNIISKSGKFTDGNKTYIQETFLGELYNTRKQISSKFFDKGLFEEETGITLLNDTLHRGQLIVKNKERRNNEFIHGECDCVKDGIVYDIKNAWDIFTFGKADLSHEYTWQLRGYMWLWECNKGRLFYCLNNTPEHLLIDEERKLFYSGNYLTFESLDYIKDCEALRRKHTYDALALEERFKVWDIDFLAEHKEQLINAVNNARTYMSELWEEHQSRLEKNRNLMESNFVIL